MNSDTCKPLPPLPQLDDFRSARLEARASDLFNPPALANFLGCLQAAPDIMAIQHLTFAPYSMGESLIAPLTLNNTSLRATPNSVVYEWRPDRITRRLTHDVFALETTTVMGVRAQTVTIALRITNTAPAARPARLRIQCAEGIIHSTTDWKTPYSPKEGPSLSLMPWQGAPPPHTLVRNRSAPLPSGAGLLFTSRTSAACSLQAASPAPDRIERHWLYFDWQLAPGETRTLHFFVAVGANAPEVLSAFDTWQRDPAATIREAENDWATEIAAVFTPGNARYSGHVPLLETTNADLRALYFNAIITVVYMRREHPDSRHGRTYVTLMPRYWVTTSFINDWSLTALLLVMLDPECVRRVLELWLARDIHSHFGTEYASGQNAGNWYACNDYAMTRLITTYMRVTGNTRWLETRAGTDTILGHLHKIAAHHRTLDRGSGLADYGDRNSLLEAVGTYEHEVASLNAANVWILRTVADLAEHLGGAENKTTSARLRAEAEALIPRIQQLYIKGAGYWNCRHPDGALVPVRHVWDFIHTLNFLHDDLPPAQIAEMISFFENELMTSHWLVALSPLDEDAAFSLRPDHQWNGSYPGWVALAAAALAKTGRHDLLLRWLPGLAASMRQGPISQAHLTEAYAPLSGGGARKAPTEFPWLNDWAILCGGAFFDFIVQDLFAFEPGYDGSIASAPATIAALDPAAVLHNIPCHGKLMCLHAKNIAATNPN